MAKRGDHSRSRAILIGTTVSADSPVSAGSATIGSLAAMRAVLTDTALCGWPEASVLTLTDRADADELRFAVRQQAEQADEVFLVYFVGPGLRGPLGQLCLGLASTRLDDLSETSLPYSLVRRELRSCRARAKVVILDCSFSGSVVESVPGLPLAGLTGIPETYILTSSDREAGAAAGDPQTALTPFTAALVAAIRTGIPAGPAVLTLDDLYPLLEDHLRQAAQPVPNRQAKETSQPLPFIRNAARLEEREPGRRRFVVMTGIVAVTAAVAGTAVAVAESHTQGKQPGHAGSGNLLSSAVPVQLEGSGDVVNRIAFSPDGRFLLGGCGTTSKPPTVSLSLWDLSASRTRGLALAHGGRTIHGVAFANAGQHFATAGDDGMVRLWTLAGGADGRLVASSHAVTICQHPPTAWEVAFSPDDTSLASSGSDQKVVISDITGRHSPIVLPHDATPSGVAFCLAGDSSLDGEYVVTGCNDGKVRVWRVADRTPSARPVLILTGHKETAIPQVAFWPHHPGSFATCSWDRTVRLWRIGSSNPIAVLDGVFEGAVTGVAFSPDGDTLATASADTVFLWDVRKLPTGRPSHAIKALGAFAVSYNRAGTHLADTSQDVVWLRRT